MKISNMKAGTIFRLGDHICIRVSAIGRYNQKSDCGEFPIYNLTWHEVKFWPGSDDGEIIGRIEVVLQGGEWHVGIKDAK